MRPLPAGPRSTRGVLVALILLLPLAACSLPRDPHGTLARLEAGGTLRAGVAPAAPYARVGADGAPAGPEPELVRRFAEELGTDVAWVVGTPHDLRAALEAGELDLAVGGFPPEEGRGTARSRPWTRTRITVGARGGPLPQRVSALEGLRVRALRGSLAAALARRRGAEVEEVERVDAAGDAVPVVAEAWRLEAAGLTPAPFSLRRTPRIVLARPGENGFLVRLDRFLHARTTWARERLVAAAADGRR